MIPLRRRRVAQGLVGSQVVVIRKPAGQAALRCQSIRVVLGIDVFLLDAPPEPLDFLLALFTKDTDQAQAALYQNPPKGKPRPHRRC